MASSRPFRWATVVRSRSVFMSSTDARLEEAMSTRVIGRRPRSVLPAIISKGRLFLNECIRINYPHNLRRSSRPDLQMNEMAWFKIGRSSTSLLCRHCQENDDREVGQKGHLADGSGQVMCSAKSIEQIHHSPLAHRQRSMWALFRKFSLSRKNLGGWQNARGRHLLVVFNGPCLLVW